MPNHCCAALQTAAFPVLLSHRLTGFVPKMFRYPYEGIPPFRQMNWANGGLMPRRPRNKVSADWRRRLRGHGIGCLTKLRIGHLAQASLGLAGHIGKDHGDMVAGMFIAGAADDHSVAIHAAIAARGLQGEGHFSPGSEGGRTAEFNSAAMDNYCVRGE